MKWHNGWKDDEMMNDARKIRVLVVDDSALARKLLVSGLSRDPQIQVIGPAGDAASAYALLVRERPDVITLDVEMPRMDGVTFLKQYMAVYPTPTVMVSLNNHDIVCADVITTSCAL